MAVWLAAVVQARDRLLTDVAALRERHRALVQIRLLRDHGLVEVEAEARAAVLDAHALGNLVGDRNRAGALQRLRERVRLPGVAQQVDPEVRADRAHRDPRHVSAHV